MNPTPEQIKSLQQKLENHLIALRNSKGSWDGKLSGSALSTAIAVFALHKYNHKKYAKHISSGLTWLATNSNLDGGWGDTDISKSNLSTTLLVWSCLSIVKDNEEFSETIKNAEKWLTERLKSLEPASISSAVLNHYQKDRTFSVPILSMCALSGRLGEKGWDLVPQLPFQMAIFPDRFFKWLNLSVVSYAIPALIAIGLVKSVKSKIYAPIARLNKLVHNKVLRILAAKQPENGGFLEATPLTGFVLMSLIGAGEKELDVCTKAADFLDQSIYSDGSWPIDTHLATWVTSLAVSAMSKEGFSRLQGKEKTVDCFLGQQLKEVHPFTMAKPGGWAWTHLQGGVPDADDTSGALIALHKLNQYKEIPLQAVENGINWLLDLQNSDGGVPTFCKGWGKLPFDRSCPDITAHAIKAFALWQDKMSKSTKKKIGTFLKKAVRYLKQVQQKDGSFLPLWFGNEDDVRNQNPVYGTSIVLYYLNSLQIDKFGNLCEAIHKAINFLLISQNPDGGWGGNNNLVSTMEETSLAVRALAPTSNLNEVGKGAQWIQQNIPSNLNTIKATPIGLYFASLWYYEDMYPLIFSTSALSGVLESGVLQTEKQILLGL